MADTPDLGFGLWLFQQLSCSYIDSYITPVFIGLSSLFPLPSTIFNPNIKLAQKLAQYLQALDLVRLAPLAPPLKSRCDADNDLQNHHATPAELQVVEKFESAQTKNARSCDWLIEKVL